jgi:nicotinate-nucleotide pyrophosphorylase (carboxylating)
MHVISNATRNLLRNALREDIGTGDVTTQVLVPRNLRGRAWIKAKSNGLMCGGPVVREVFRLVDSRLRVTQAIGEGKRVKKGAKLFTIRGRLSSILTAERVVLNFLGHLSGIATLTNQFVSRVRGTRARILDTRKTTPSWRDLEKQAVRAGGGENHRFGLWDEMMVKDNHWNAMNGLLERTRCRYFGSQMRKYLKRKRIPVEIEVRRLRELQHLLQGDYFPDRILLDHFSVAQLKKAVSFVRKRRRRPKLEASGGITLANVRAIARTGVDRISVGAITHSASALDVSLTIEPTH